MTNLINLKTNQSLFATIKEPKATYYIVENIDKNNYSLYKETFEYNSRWVEDEYHIFWNDEYRDKTIVNLLSTDADPLSLKKISELDFNENGYYNFEVLYSKAKSLPNGWYWVKYDDGSGHLLSPQGDSYYNYSVTQEFGWFQIEYKDLDGLWGSRTDLRKDNNVQKIWSSFFNRAETEIINMLKSPNQDNKNSNINVEPNIDI